MSWVEFIHYGTSRATAEAVVLAKDVLAASLDRLRVFGSTICVEMTMLEFVDCGDHFERLRECETKMDDLCRPFEAHIAHLDTVTGVDQRAAQDALAEIGMDMSHFPSYKHLSSWARICPGNTESAGKRKRGADRERRPVGESHPGPVCPRRRWHHRHLSESTVPALCPAQRQEASGRSRRP